MASTIYKMDLRASYQESLLAKLGQLIMSAGVSQMISPRDLVAVKLHFGEPGNVAFIRPVFLQTIVSAIREAGGKPFLTDTNTLYVGHRTVAPDHITAAIKNGFSYSVVEAPIIIADGLKGTNDIEVSVSQKQFDKVHIAADIIHADALVSLAHFKGHELSGFGGSLKNIGMGCASRKGKLAQHSGVAPKVKRKRCVGCGDCIENCSQQAISLKDETAQIEPERCIGCGECIMVCPNGAIQVQWNPSTLEFQEKMMEYAYGALKDKQGKLLFINFITDVSPACDCAPANDAPIVRDIGVLASTDPVALDQASVDLVNKESALPGSCLTDHLLSGEDKFKGVYPKIDWSIQLEYAERLGIGSRSYTIKEIREEKISVERGD
jgi:uncharacterized protein